MKFKNGVVQYYLDPSPSVWRVWIEIRLGYIRFTDMLSPSVWRVWIEIIISSVVNI